MPGPSSAVPRRTSWEARGDPYARRAPRPRGTTGRGRRGRSRPRSVRARGAARERVPEEDEGHRDEGTVADVPAEGSPERDGAYEPAQRAPRGSCRRQPWPRGARGPQRAGRGQGGQAEARGRQEPQVLGDPCRSDVRGCGTARRLSRPGRPRRIRGRRWLSPRQEPPARAGRPRTRKANSTRSRMACFRKRAKGSAPAPSFRPKKNSRRRGRRRARRSGTAG